MKNLFLLVILSSLLFSCNSNNSEVIGSWNIKSLKVDGENKMFDSKEKMFFRSDSGFVIDHGRGRIEKGNWEFVGKDSIIISFDKNPSSKLIGSYNFTGTNLLMNLNKDINSTENKALNFEFELVK